MNGERPERIEVDVRPPAGRIAALRTAGDRGQRCGQPSEEDAASAVGALDLPQSITLMGKADPNVRKATAIVNGEVLTKTDVDQRLALVILANSGKVSDEEKERMRLQVFRNLVDETLQIPGSARSRKSRFRRTRSTRTSRASPTNFKYSPDGFAKYLASQGSSATSMKRQIEAQLALESRAPPRSSTLRQRIGR